MDINKKRAYARLVLKGVAASEGEWLHINASVDIADFVHLVVEEAFKMGVYDVDVNYSDGVVNKLQLNMCHEDALTEDCEWSDLHTMTNIERKARYLGLGSPNHLNSQGLDMQRLMKASRHRSKADELEHDMIGSNRLKWCSCAVPNPVWAKLVFPELPEDEAVERLWEDILKCCYADSDDPEAAWAAHEEAIFENIGKLNAMGLSSLHFTSANGTDITVGLCDCNIFEGGSECGPDGIYFDPNMPTEEIFTSPHRLKTNGVVKSTKPLMRNGTLIDNFSITFKDGRVTDVSAESGLDYLKELIDTDEGSHYLGEVALVSKFSPINLCNHLFYSTLFDENAACHLALGRGFEGTLAVPEEERTKENLEALGLNYSRLHLDFMFGSDDLRCIGATKDGRQVLIMEDGQFVI